MLTSLYKTQILIWNHVNVLESNADVIISYVLKIEGIKKALRLSS